MNYRTCWRAILPPMIQRLIRTGLIIRVRVRVIQVWWDIVGRSSWLRSRCRLPRDWWWSCRRSTLNFYTRTRKRGSSGTLGEREVSLIKVSSLSNHCLLCSRIIELPALISPRVANEYTLLYVWAKTSSLVPLYVHIGSAAPNLKVGDIRFPSMPEFIRGGLLFKSHLEMTVNAQVILCI